jgi:hypothetical protein
MEIRKQILTDGEMITIAIKRKRGLTNDNEGQQMLMDSVETEVSKNLKPEVMMSILKQRVFFQLTQEMRIYFNLHH